MNNNFSNLVLVRAVKNWLQKARSWWIDRWVAESIAETVLEHINKVVKAASILWRKRKTLIFDRIINIARYHDTAEYKEKDYVPWEIEKSEKHNREKIVMLELKEKCNNKQWDKIFNYRIEHESQASEESKLVHQLDKIDAAVQALCYEKIWYDRMTDFYPYTRDRIIDPILLNIFDILMKKEFMLIDPYIQYFSLLECEGDEKVFREKMKSLL